MSIAKIRELFQQSQGQAESLVGKVVDLFRISWGDEGEGLEKVCLFIKKEIYPILGSLFKVSPLATYTVEDILDIQERIF